MRFMIFAAIVAATFAASAWWSNATSATTQSKAGASVETVATTPAYDLLQYAY